MFRIILFILGAIVLYKLIFGLIIPVYRASRDIKKRFRDINQQMQDRMNQGNQGATETPNLRTTEKNPAKGQDYIDFEEVK